MMRVLPTWTLPRLGEKTGLNSMTSHTQLSENLSGYSTGATSCSFTSHPHLMHFMLVLTQIIRYIMFWWSSGVLHWLSHTYSSCCGIQWKMWFWIGQYRAVLHIGDPWSIHQIRQFLGLFFSSIIHARLFENSNHQMAWISPVVLSLVMVFSNGVGCTSPEILHVEPFFHLLNMKIEQTLVWFWNVPVDWSFQKGWEGVYVNPLFCYCTAYASRND